MKFLCACGKVISDNTDFLPYKGYVISDEEISVHEKIVEDIEAYIKAKSEGKNEEWQAAHFSEDYAKLNLPEQGILYDVITKRTREVEFAMYQCTECRRLHVSSRLDRTGLHVFVPEGHQADIFKKGVATD